MATQATRAPSFIGHVAAYFVEHSEPLVKAEVRLPIVEERREPEKPQVIVEEKNDPVYKSELQKFYYEFVGDLSFFCDKYPLLSVVGSVAFGFFGLFNVLSFSPTNILTGACLLVVSGSLIYNIVFNKGFSIFSEAYNSLIQTITFYRQKNQTPAPAVAQAAPPAAPAPAVRAQNGQAAN